MMAITFVNSASATNNNGGNATITFGGTLADDCVIVAVTLGSSKSPTLSVASSSGGAFQKIVSEQRSSSANFAVFRQIVSSASLITQAVITGTGGSSDTTTGVAHVFRGVSSGTPEDTASTATTGNSSLPDSPSITPASDSNNLPFAAVTSVGLQIVSTLIGPVNYLNPLTVNANDNVDATTGQAWVTVQSTAVFNPATWTASASGIAWCSATTLLRPFVPTWGESPRLDHSDFRLYDILGY